GPLVVLAPGELEYPAEVARPAEVPLVPVVPDPRVARHVLAADGLGAVGRGVVGDHQLEVGERLREESVERRPEVPLPVVDGDGDADAGRSRAGAHAPRLPAPAWSSAAWAARSPLRNASSDQR